MSATVCGGATETQVVIKFTHTVGNDSDFIPVEDARTVVAGSHRLASRFPTYHAPASHPSLAGSPVYGLVNAGGCDAVVTLSWNISNAPGLERVTYVKSTIDAPTEDEGSYYVGPPECGAYVPPHSVSACGNTIAGSKQYAMTVTDDDDATLVPMHVCDNFRDQFVTVLRPGQFVAVNIAPTPLPENAVLVMTAHIRI